MDRKKKDKMIMEIIEDEYEFSMWEVE